MGIFNQRTTKIRTVRSLQGCLNFNSTRNLTIQPYLDYAKTLRPIRILVCRGPATRTPLKTGLSSFFCDHDLCLLRSTMTKNYLPKSVNNIRHKSIYTLAPRRGSADGEYGSRHVHLPRYVIRGSDHWGSRRFTDIAFGSGAGWH